MKIEEMFPMGVNVCVTEVYADEGFYRTEEIEAGEKLTECQRKNILRLKGSVGKVVGHDRTYGSTAHSVVVVEFYNEEQWMFVPEELTVTTEEPNKTPPEFEEVDSYTPLTAKEVELAEKIFITTLQSMPYEKLVSVLYSEGQHPETVAGNAILAARAFQIQTALRWSNGVVLKPKDNW